MVPFSDNHADIICEVLVCECVVNFWHLPECQIYKAGTGCKAGDKCMFPHHMVDRYTSHETFSKMLILNTHHIVAQGVAACV